MSAAAVFYIEYRRPGEAWHLYQNFVPVSKELYDKKLEEAKRYGYINNDYIEQESASSSELSYCKRNNHLSFQGYLRDSFSTRGFDCEFEDIADRGFPTDMSEELVQLNENYLVHAHKYDGRVMDERYAKTWFTLGELEEYSNILENKLYDEVKADLEAVVKAEYRENIKGIYGRLDDVMTILTLVAEQHNMSVEPKEKDEEVESDNDYDSPEGAREMLTEMLESRAVQYAQIHGLYVTVDNLIKGYLSTDWGDGIEARVIMYICN